MKPGIRRLVWLGGIVGTGALVVAVVNGRADGDAASRQVPVSLVSVRINGHDPYAYFKDELDRLPTHPASRIDELLPHRWLPS